MDTIEDTASDWLDHLRVERGASAHTVSNYRRDIRRYAHDLGARGITDIAGVRAADIEAHLASLASGGLTGAPAAPASVARASAAIRGLHAYALRQGRVGADAAAEVRAPKQGSYLPKALSVDQVSRLLDAAHSAPGAAGLR
ncbi:MAG: site-specific integrase, partial [Schaalia georgiae]|nr:site-specific integrase [Schaalia georgiae]